MPSHPPSFLRRAALLAVVLLAPAGPLAAGERPPWQLETKEARRVGLTLTLEVEAPQAWRGEVTLVTARAPELPGQREVSTVMKPAGRPAADASPLQRPVLVYRRAGAPGPRQFSVTLQYRATLLSRRLVPVPDGARPAAVAPLDAAQRKLYLRAQPAFDFNSRSVQAWLDDHQMRRKEGEAPVDFARRVHLEIGKAFRYRFPAGHDGKCSTVCKAGLGDCGSLSVVFVSVLRANRIPARTLVGGTVNTGAADPAAPPYGYHVTAEFYADGVGWVPLDPANYLGRPRAERLASFGQDEGRFFTQHVDPDVVVSLPGRGLLKQSVLQQPGRWFKGPGPWDGLSFNEKWAAEVLPARKKGKAGK
jgi:hypothetical protein